MYDNWLANAVVVLATIAVVCLCVMVHYEGLNLLARGLAKRRDRQSRRKVLYGIFAALVLHTIEIWLFGMTYWALLLWPETGHVISTGRTGFLDMIYLSAMTYTTVGFGDLAPVGPIRFLAGTQALTGLVLITWSASFSFLEMERYWRR
ncbi:MAG: potassium channel family protein [Gammaproteobacteria bacterium]|nr:potassium channel family protein [Gammaproteobacteria bacterium]